MPTRTEWRDMLEAIAMGHGMGTGNTQMVNFVRSIQERRLQDEERRRAQAVQMQMRREEIRARADEARTSRAYQTMKEALKGSQTPELLSEAGGKGFSGAVSEGLRRRTGTELTAEKAEAARSPGGVELRDIRTTQAGAEAEARWPTQEKGYRLQDTLARGRDASRRKEEESKGKTLAERNAERRDPNWDERTGAEQATAIVKEQTILNAIREEARLGRPSTLSAEGKLMLQANLPSAIEAAVELGNLDAARILAEHQANPTTGREAAISQLAMEMLDQQEAARESGATGSTGTSSLQQETPPTHVPSGSSFGDTGGMFSPGGRLSPREKRKPGELTGYGPGGQPIYQE